MHAKIMVMQTRRWFVRANWIKNALDRWNRNLTTRRQLRKLDDQQLRDIGIDRSTAEQEADKSFWQN